MSEEPADDARTAAGQTLPERTEQLRSDFLRALERTDAQAAVAAALTLDELILEWAADTVQSDEVDRARATLRDMIVRLGAAAQEGLVDPAQRIAPFVQLLLVERDRARADRDYPRADRLRDALADVGVEVRDTPDGSEWVLE